MIRAFISALGAMRANQDWMDVIGNNLANSNTLGYKSARALFSDQFSATLRAAEGPSTASGGRNPMQVGMGTILSSIDRDFNQGALSVTGRTFDLALSGRGFFAVEGADRTLYTRVGTFALDSMRRLSANMQAANQPPARYAEALDAYLAGDPAAAAHLSAEDLDRYRSSGEGH